MFIKVFTSHRSPRLCCWVLCTLLSACGGGGGGDAPAIVDTTSSAPTGGTEVETTGATPSSSEEGSQMPPSSSNEDDSEVPSSSSEEGESTPPVTSEEAPNTVVVPPPEASASVEANLKWSSPGTRENGEKLYLYELGGYEIRFKLAGDELYQSVTLDEAEATQYKVINLLPGEYEFMIAAFDSDGVYSAFSQAQTVLLQ